MLRAGRVVEIDQRHARADLTAENRKISAVGQGVQRRGLHERTHQWQTFPGPDGSELPSLTGE